MAATEQGSVAVDTETTSLDALSADLVGVSLALAPGRACYLPLGHGAPAGDGGLDLGGARGAPKQIPLEDALSALKPLLKDPGVLKIGQNIKYDELVLSRYDVAIEPLDDTMLLSYVLDGGLRTADIMQPGKAKVSTSVMGEAITRELDKLAG